MKSDCILRKIVMVFMYTVSNECFTIFPSLQFFSAGSTHAQLFTLIGIVVMHSASVVMYSASVVMHVVV